MRFADLRTLFRRTRIRFGRNQFVVRIEYEIRDAVSRIRVSKGVLFASDDFHFETLAKIVALLSDFRK